MGSRKHRRFLLGVCRREIDTTLVMSAPLPSSCWGCDVRFLAHISHENGQPELGTGCAPSERYHIGFVLVRGCASARVKLEQGLFQTAVHIHHEKEKRTWKFENKLKKGGKGTMTRLQISGSCFFSPPCLLSTHDKNDINLSLHPASNRSLVQPGRLSHNTHEYHLSYPTLPYHTLRQPTCQTKQRS